MISNYKNQIDKLLLKKEAAEHVHKMISDERVKANEHLEDTLTAQRIVQDIAQAIQQQVHDRIAGVVSRCLEAVFDDPYDFRIIFEQKRGRTEAVLVFVRDGVEVDPMTASGGGVVDLAAFALRLACLMLVRPPVRRLLVLDEPFRFVSVEYRRNIGAMLEGLAADIGVQFVLVTHMEDLKMGKVISLSAE